MKKLLTLVALVALCFGVQAKVVEHTIDYTTWTELKFFGWGASNEARERLSLDGENGLHFHSEEATDPGWACQFHPFGFEGDVEDGTIYTLSMEIKASGAFGMNGGFVGQNGWGKIQVPESSDWQTLSFEYEGVAGGGTALLLQCGDFIGDYWIKWIKVSYTEKEQEAPEWPNIIENGDAEGEYGEVACAIGKVFGGNPEPAKIEEEADGNHVFVVNATAKSADAWDNQFWINLPRTFAAGEKMKLSFRYKATSEARTTTQCHTTPGNYVHWGAIGDVNFTTEWQTFEKTFVVPNEANGMQSIAFNLSEIEEANDYYFDDIAVLTEPEKPIEWTNCLVNGDAEGNYAETACVWTKVNEVYAGGPAPARIMVDGSNKVFVANAGAMVEFGWDNQLWLVAPQSFSNGDAIQLSFRYKADKPATVGTQTHTNPGDYKHWACIGNVNFTTEWQTYEGTINVNGEMDGLKSIAFNLNDFPEANNYYIDDVVWKVNPEANPIPEQAATVTPNWYVPQIAEVLCAVQDYQNVIATFSHHEFELDEPVDEALAWCKSTYNVVAERYAAGKFETMTTLNAQAQAQLDAIEAALLASAKDDVQFHLTGVYNYWYGAEDIDAANVLPYASLAYADEVNAAMIQEAINKIEKDIDDTQAMIDEYEAYDAEYHQSIIDECDAINYESIPEILAWCHPYEVEITWEKIQNQIAVVQQKVDDYHYVADRLNFIDHENDEVADAAQMWCADKLDEYQALYDAEMAIINDENADPLAPEDYKLTLATSLNDEIYDVYAENEEGEPVLVSEGWLTKIDDAIFTIGKADAQFYLTGIQNLWENGAGELRGKNELQAFCDILDETTKELFQSVIDKTDNTVVALATAVENYSGYSEEGQAEFPALYDAALDAIKEVNAYFLEVVNELTWNAVQQQVAQVEEAINNFHEVVATFMWWGRPSYIDEQVDAVSEWCENTLAEYEAKFANGELTALEDGVIVGVDWNAQVDNVIYALNKAAQWDAKQYAYRAYVSWNGQQIDDEWIPGMKEEFEDVDTQDVEDAISALRTLANAYEGYSEESHEAVIAAYYAVFEAISKIGTPVVTLGELAAIEPGFDDVVYAKVKVNGARVTAVYAIDEDLVISYVEDETGAIAMVETSAADAVLEQGTAITGSLSGAWMDYGMGAGPLFAIEEAELQSMYVDVTTGQEINEEFELGYNVNRLVTVNASKMLPINGNMVGTAAIIEDVYGVLGENFVLPQNIESVTGVLVEINGMLLIAPRSAADVVAVDPLYTSYGLIAADEDWESDYQTAYKTSGTVSVVAYEDNVIIKNFDGVEGFDLKVNFGLDAAVTGVYVLSEYGCEDATADWAFSGNDYWYVIADEGYSYAESDPEAEEGYVVLSAFVGEEFDYVYYYVAWSKDVTTITAITADGQLKGVYNLAGQKVNVAKGMVINNGKVMFVK